MDTTPPSSTTAPPGTLEKAKGVYALYFCGGTVALVILIGGFMKDLVSGKRGGSY